MRRNIRRIGLFIAALGLAGGCVCLSRREGERLGETTPVLLAVKSEGGGRLTVLWRSPRKTAGIAEYRLERQKAGQPFQAWKRFAAPDVGGEVQTAAMTGAASGEVYSFRVASVPAGGAGVESAPSAILSARVQDIENGILVVRDDGPAGGFDASGGSVPLYSESLDKLKTSFDSCLSDAVLSGDIGLTGYRSVLWTCGQEGREPLTAEERALLKSYLDREGNLFICGSGLGPALAGRGAEPEGREFYQDYLKAYYEPTWERLPAQARLEGGPEAPVWEKVQARFDGDSGRGPGGRPCRLEPYGGSESALFYAEVSGASAAAVAYVGNFGTPNAFSRVVYLGVPWERVSPLEQRTALMQAVLRYLTKAGPLKPIGGVRGSVVDARTGEGLETVKIRLLGGANYLGVQVRTFTKPDGTFSLVALQGTYHLIAEAPGYRPAVVHNVRIRQARPSEVSVVLEPARKP